MKKYFTPAIAAIASLALTTDVAAQMVRFNPYTFVSLSKAGMNAANPYYFLYTTTTPENNNFTLQASFQLPVTAGQTLDINGIGLNAHDSLLYGASWNSAMANFVSMAYASSLYRIDNTGATEDLGYLPVPAGSAPLKFVNFAAGTIDSAGSYYYISYGFKPSGLTKLQAKVTNPSLALNLDVDDLVGYLCRIDNVKDLPVNPGMGIAPFPSAQFSLDFSSNASVAASLQAYLDDINANFPAVFNADGGIQDIDFNPLNGKLYGYISYPSGGTTVGRPIEFIDAIVEGAPGYRIEPLGTEVNAQPGQELAGLAISSSGQMYGLFTTGHYAEIEGTTGALGTVETPLAFSGIPTANGNLRGDLARAFNPPHSIPVTLLSFDAKTLKGKVALNWAAASEQNLNFYQVEHSADAQNWTALTTVKGKENTNLTVHYEYTHNKPFEGKNFYRLKIVDKDGTFEYSPVRLLAITEAQPMDIYPNPVSNRLHIEANGRDVRQMSIYDAQGRLILLINKQSNSINTANLQAGTYIIEIQTSKGDKIRKIFTKL